MSKKKAGAYSLMIRSISVKNCLMVSLTARLILFFALVAIGSGVTPQAFGSVPVEPAQVIKRFPHDVSAFTEGLFYRDGYLYESTGLSGRSVIRKVDLYTGKILIQARIPDSHFGEGIVDWQNRLISVTWRSGTGYVWDFPALTLQEKFHYAGEGWGLTHDEKTLILSDGSACLKHLDPVSLQVVSRLCVTADGTAVSRLNELEYIHGEIWANIWMTPMIARIDPVTGQVKGWIDLTSLEEQLGLDDPDAVPNGIAYDQINDRIFVTGKYWPIIYHIKSPVYKK